jgi:mono/diheme cytochrome c family protein
MRDRQGHLADLLLAAAAIASALAAGLPQCVAAEPASNPTAAGAESNPRQFVESYCIACHDDATKAGGLALAGLTAAPLAENAATWERVIRKLAARQMPPEEEPRPTEHEYRSAISALAKSLDEAAAASPNPGRTESLRRLNRTEYQNTIRDLLAVEIDAEALLPADEASHGFDNITVSNLSPALLARYISAAEKISRRAVGRAPASPQEETFRVRPDITQDGHIAGLPLGTRGGTLISYDFPASGEYEIQVHLMRDRNEEVEGLREPHELEILLDRERAGLHTVRPPRGGASQASIDANLTARVRVDAGTHQVGATFVEKSSSLAESLRQPLNVHFNFYRHPRQGPAVYQVSIRGPLAASGEAAGSDTASTVRLPTYDETPSRRRLFVARPKDPADEAACAKQVLATLLRRAYRRPIDEDDLAVPLAHYEEGHAAGGFEAGIEAAVAAVLVQPQFLFRIERDPPDVAPGTAYRLSDIELASRLSYFLWSSMPDDELLDLAAAGKLSQPEELDRQVRRMLADRRSQALVTNFAGQWLYLRNLESLSPDMRLFPDFDDNLRQAMRQETERLFEHVLRGDRSVRELIAADYTFLNERLARHYGIPHVHGSRFRRVPLGGESPQAQERGGILRHASVLSVTSYATRTSPVIRGNWVLANLLGSPPPPPPPDVPALADNTVSSQLSVRERLAEHRANAACASCHNLMDPVGFALENYDAVGRWRTTEAGEPIDVAGGLPGGGDVAGVTGIEQAILARPQLLARTLTEKLLTFALGRGVEHYDAPAVRKIVADAAAEDYRMSRLILGVVQSTPFQMRRAP